MVVLDVDVVDVVEVLDVLVELVLEVDVEEVVVEDVPVRLIETKSK